MGFEQPNGAIRWRRKTWKMIFDMTSALNINVLFTLNIAHFKLFEQQFLQQVNLVLSPKLGKNTFRLWLVTKFRGCLNGKMNWLRRWSFLFEKGWALVTWDASKDKLICHKNSAELCLNTHRVLVHTFLSLGFAGEAPRSRG